MAQFYSSQSVNTDGSVTSLTLLGFEKNSFTDQKTGKVTTYFKGYAAYPIESKGDRRFDGLYACQLTLAEDTYDYLRKSLDELPADLINVELVSYTSFGERKVRLQSFEIPAKQSDVPFKKEGK